MSDHFDRGLALYELHKFDAAETELRKALAQEPDNAVAHALLGSALLAQKKPEKAMQEAKLAVKFAPDIAFPYYVLAMSQTGMGKFKDGEKTIKESLRIEPENELYLGTASLIASMLDKWPESLHFAELGLAQDPENVCCINRRAEALVRLNRYPEAEQSLELALELEPENSTTHSIKGWTLVRRGRIEEAIEHFKEALRVDPNSEWAYEGIVEALKARNPFYQSLLMGSLAFSEMNRHARTALIWTCWIIPPLRGLLLLVWLSGFMSRLVFTTLLRFDPLGRRVLSDKAKRDNNIKLALVGGTIMLFSVIAIIPKPHSIEHNKTKIALSMYKAGKEAEANKLWQSAFAKAVKLDKAGDNSSALEVLEDLKSHMVRESAEDKRLSIKVHLLRGEVLAKLSEEKKALDSYEEATTVAVELGDRNLQVQGWLGQAQVWASKPASLWWQGWNAQTLDCCQHAMQLMAKEPGWSETEQSDQMANAIALLKEDNHSSLRKVEKILSKVNAELKGETTSSAGTTSTGDADGAESVGASALETGAASLGGGAASKAPDPAASKARDSASATEKGRGNKSTPAKTTD